MTKAQLNHVSDTILAFTGSIPPTILNIAQFINQTLKDFKPQQVLNTSTESFIYNLSKGTLEKYTRKKVPDLKLLKDKSETRKMIYKFMNKQNIRMAVEHEPQSISLLRHSDTALLAQAAAQPLRSQHVEDGIMRRNKLLLEHILHCRLAK